VDEIKTVEWMPLVFNPPLHVRAAYLAGMPLNHRRRVDDVQLVAVLKHGQILARGTTATIEKTAPSASSI
jgi:hypothetical protein